MCLNAQEDFTVPEGTADLLTITVEPDKPHAERMAAYLRQIGNPYFFTCGDMAVKLGFCDGETTLEDCLESYFRGL